MPLTDTAIRQAKPAERPFKLTDGEGMFLLVNPNGRKWWRLQYYFNGKQKLLSLGVYPDVTLKAAREKRDEARRLLAEGIDPSQHRKATRTMLADRDSGTFEAVAREWFAKNIPTWAPTHASKIINRLEKDVFPWLGARPIGEINAPELLAVLRRIESRGAVETAHRAMQNAGQVFRYAVATGRAERNPAADLRGALAPTRRQHFPSITDPKAIGDLLRTIQGYQGSYVTKAALELAPLVFVRPGELRKAEWTEFDLAAAEWRIPGHKMKMREAHQVPLSRQAVAILEALRPLTGGGRYVFPGARSTAVP